MSLPYMLGIKGIQFVWHGEWSDPEVIIKRKRFNYWDIEEIMWEIVEDDYNIKFNDNVDKFHEFVGSLPQKEKRRIYWNICEVLGI